MLSTKMRHVRPHAPVVNCVLHMPLVEGVVWKMYVHLDPTKKNRDWAGLQFVIGHACIISPWTNKPRFC